MKYIKLILLLIPLLINAQIDKGEVIYKAHKNDELMRERMKKQGISTSMINKIAAPEKDIKIFLKFSGNKSLSSGVPNQKELGIGLTSTVKPKTVVYFDGNTKEQLLLKPKFGKTLINRPSQEWEVTTESKMIGTYKCFKAITYDEKENSSGQFKDVVEAWFAPELSVPFGPYYFNGLPGLILELTKSNGTLTYRAIEINIPAKVTVERPQGKKIITQEEADEIIKKNYYSLMNN